MIGGFRRTARHAFVGLTTLGILMLVVLHPDVPVKVVSFAAKSFKGMIALGRRGATV